MGTLTNSGKLIEKIQNMRSVVTGNTAPSNPSAGDLWYDTTSTVKALKMYDGTSWVIVGPELVSLTQAEYDALPAAEKSNGKFYLITDASGSISIAWSQITGAPISSGSSAPSNPNEGDIWYDTTNDVLKAYDGTNWNEVGSDAADINTKTFYLSSTSDLTNAQAAYDWYTAGKNPIIVYNGYAYIRNTQYGYPNSLSFYKPNRVTTESGGTSAIKGGQYIWFGTSNNTVTSIYTTVENNVGFLGTGFNNTFTPTQDGHPATKKYVDDSVSGKVSKGTNVSDDLTLFTITDSSSAGEAGFGSSYMYMNNSNGSGAEIMPGSISAGDGSVDTSIGGGGVSISNPTDMVHSSLSINKINYTDNIDSISEDYEFIGGGNNQIARLKDFSNYLAKNNTTAFTPTGDYNPSTKKYVDDSVSVVSGDSGVEYTIKVSNSVPASGTASNIITIVTN